MLADELDLHNKRVEFAEKAKFDLSTISKLHWFKHHFVDHVTVQNGTIEITLNFPNNAEEFQNMFKEFIEEKLTEQIELVNPFLREATNGLLSINPKILINMITDGSGKIKRNVPPDVIAMLITMQGKEKESRNASLECKVKTIYPKPSTIFTGRKIELKQFQDAFSNHNFISIEGVGGIGKTEFAAKCIEDFCSKDSVVWFDCLPDSKLDTLIDFAGYKDVLKGENKTELAKYSGFVDLIDRDKKIIFLDNFQDALDKSFNDCFAFADRRLRDAKFIFISREHPQIGIKVVPIPLEGLKDDFFYYAKKLISSYYRDIRIDDGTLKILCDQLDGHPLAIDFALQLIRYGESPTYIIPKIAEFKGSELSNRLLAEVFDHPKSTEIQKKLMLRFSVFRRDVDKNGLIQIMDGENIDETVRILIDKKMLVISQQSGEYYNTHPLVREFCYLRLDINEKNDTHIKVANYLKHFRVDKFDPALEEEIFHHYYMAKSLEDAANIILQKGESFIFSGHINSLKSMMDLMISVDIIKPQFDLYYGNIATIHSEWDVALIHYEKASSSEDEKVMAEAYIRFGEILFRKGCVKESLKYFEDGLTISEKKGYKKQQSRALTDIGLVYNFQGNINEALKKYETSLKIGEEIEDKEGIADTLNNIGNAYNYQGNIRGALEKYEKCLKLREEIGDIVGLAVAMLNMGRVYHYQANLREALKKCETSLKISEKIGDKKSIAEAFNSIGVIYSDQGNQREALKKYKISLKISKEIGDIEGIANKFNNIGSVSLLQGNIIEALEYHEKSLKINEDIGDKENIAVSLNFIGNVYNSKGNRREALKKYESSLKISEEIGDKKGAATSFHNIGFTHADLKQYDFALFYLLMSLSLKTQMGVPIDNIIKSIEKIKHLIGLEKFTKIVKEQMIKLPSDLKEYCLLPVELLKDNTVKHSTSIVGRNDPCLCGSGKKYKKCCGA